MSTQAPALPMYALNIGIPIVDLTALPTLTAYEERGFRVGRGSLSPDSRFVVFRVLRCVNTSC